MNRLRRWSTIFILTAGGIVTGPFLLALGLVFTTTTYQAIRYGPLTESRSFMDMALGFLGELLSYAVVPICIHGMVLGAVGGYVMGTVIIKKE
jgi:hypothetical protein